MLRKIKNRLLHIYNDFSSWKTDRKIIVIESDDWGSIRMASKESYKKLIEYGIKVDKDPYCKYDILETADDLTALFEVLSKHIDKKGNPAVFTANVIVANPDFDKIRESNFEKYHYQTVNQTFKRYHGDDACVALWKKGSEKKIFHSQFHGREHLNVERWLNYLRQGSEETLFSFDLEVFGISTTISTEKRKSYMAAFDADSKSQIENQKEIIADGLKLFYAIFGYHSQSFIAPNYTWSPELNQTLHENKVAFFQGNRAQKTPDLISKSITTINHFIGERNKFGQIYLTRNVIFEPSFDENKNWVSDALKQIDKNFKNKKPSIITTHRLNYVSSLDESNRDKNLRHLDNLLSQILQKWPDAEFMTSDELGRIIKDNK